MQDHCLVCTANQHNALYRNIFLSFSLPVSTCLILKLISHLSMMLTRHAFEGTLVILRATEV